MNIYKLVEESRMKELEPKDQKLIDTPFYKAYEFNTVEDHIRSIKNKNHTLKSLNS